MKFPIGGIVRERACAGPGRKCQDRIWCNSKTDSKVWMEEDVMEKFGVQYSAPKKGEAVVGMPETDSNT